MTSATLALRRTDGTLAVSCGDVELFRYVYEPEMDPFEGPKPYLHPVRTLAGDVVTGYRPHDHRWHKGLQMTASEVSGQNFWGGGSYVRDRGYVDLPNVGTMRHQEFTVAGGSTGDGAGDGDGDGAGDRAGGGDREGCGRIRISERLGWHTQSGEHWVDEERVLTVRDVIAEGAGADTWPGRSWALSFTTTLRNVRGAALEFGSPTTNGRELAGYTGLFWRGPRAFTGGEIITSDGPGGPGAMGAKGAWLAFVGRHDEVDRTSTLLFADAPADLGTGSGSRAGIGSGDCRPVTRWFVRNEPFAAVNPSFAFFEPVIVEPDGVLSLAHRVVVADGAWGRDSIERYLEEHPWERGG